MKNTFFILVTSLLMSCGFLWSGEYDIKILFTGDSGGRPLAFNYMREEGMGGMPARQTVIQNIIGGKKKDTMLIVDTGGFVLGRPESNIMGGTVDAAAMNKMGYDVTGLGIPELFTSAAYLKKLYNASEFDFLSANLSINTGGNEDMDIFQPYYVHRIGNVFKNLKIGIFSVVTEDAAKLMSSDAQSEFTISDPIKAAKTAVQELKETEECDFIIALTYLGYYPDDSKTGSQTLANKVEGIDLIIDGRNGIKFDSPVEINGVKLVQTGKLGLYVGEVSIKIDKNDRKNTTSIKSFNFQQHSVNHKVNGQYIGNRVEEDEKVASLISRKLSSYERLVTKKITNLQSPLSSTGVRSGETTIGNLLCDALVKTFSVDAAFIQAGAFSEAEIDKKAKITRQSFDGILKYDNSVYIFEIEGKDLEKLIKFSMKRIGYGPFLQVGGVKFNYSKSSGMLTNLKVGGEDIEYDKTYRIATNSWLARGGDGYTLFLELSEKNDMNILTREVLYDYLDSQKSVKVEQDGRITILD